MTSKQTKLPAVSIQTLLDNHETSRKAFEAYKSELNERERYLQGKPRQLNDQQIKDGKTNVNDPRIFATTFERSIRVMSQLATGKFKGVSSDDTGKNILMNLILERYVVPNANSQFDFLAKLRLIDWYSLAYGSMVALVDWVVSENYIGPDLFLIPIYNVYPQPNVTFGDMSWCQIVTDVDKATLEGYNSKEGKEAGWQNLDEFFLRVEQSTGDSPVTRDSEELSLNDTQYNTQAENTKAFPRFRLITEYRRDRWITFSPDYKLILRDIPNPHENDKLPIVIKYCFPQIDFTFGLSEVEISKSLADVIETLYNLAIDDAKMQLFPPLFMHPGSVQAHTIRMRPNARWIALQANAPMPQQVATSNRGASSALDMRQMAIGSFQTLAGSSDTTVKQGEEASMGKTPQALKMQEARQSTRDEFDRFCMEAFITQVYSRFANLIVKKMPQEITFRLFETEIEQLKKYYEDIEELADGENNTKQVRTQNGRVHIPAEFWDNYIFDYEITPGSTYKMDQQTQADNLQYILEMAQNPTIKEELEKQGKRLDIAETISRLLVNSGIQDPDKLLVDIPQESLEQPEEMPPQEPQLPGDQLAGQIPTDPGMGQLPVDQIAGQIPADLGQMPQTAPNPAFSSYSPTDTNQNTGMPQPLPQALPTQAAPQIPVMPPQAGAQERDPQIVAMEQYIQNLRQGVR